MVIDMYRLEDTDKELVFKIVWVCDKCRKDIRFFEDTYTDNLGETIYCKDCYDKLKGV